MFLYFLRFKKIIVSVPSVSQVWIINPSFLWIIPGVLFFLLFKAGTNRWFLSGCVIFRQKKLFPPLFLCVSELIVQKVSSSWIVILQITRCSSDVCRPSSSCWWKHLRPAGADLSPLILAEIKPTLLHTFFTFFYHLFLLLIDHLFSSSAPLTSPSDLLHFSVRHPPSFHLSLYLIPCSPLSVHLSSVLSWSSSVCSCSLHRNAAPLHLSRREGRMKGGGSSKEGVKD